MELWMRCYARWLPPLDLVNGGGIQYTVFNTIIAEKVRELRETLSTMQIPLLRAKQMNGRASQAVVDVKTVAEVARPNVSAFHPFTWNRNKRLASQSLVALNASLIDPIRSLDTQSLASQINAD